MLVEIELVEANPSFAEIRYPSGREDNVSLRDLAPIPCETHSPINELPEPNEVSSPGTFVRDRPAEPVHDGADNREITPAVLNDVLVPELTELDPPLPRRSSRTSKPPDRYVPG